MLQVIRTVSPVRKTSVSEKMRIGCDTTCPRWTNAKGARRPAAGMIAMVEPGTVQPSCGWRMAADMDKFCVRDESRPEGRLFGPQGRMPAIGLWAVGTNEPHARDKTVHGRRRRRMAADMDKFPHWGRKPSREALIQLTGANAGHRVGNDLRKAGTDKLPRSGRKSFREVLVRFFAGGGHASVMAPVSPVTRIQSPIKGKAQKNAFLQNQ